MSSDALPTTMVSVFSCLGFLEAEAPQSVYIPVKMFCIWFYQNRPSVWGTAQICPHQPKIRFSPKSCCKNIG